MAQETRFTSYDDQFAEPFNLDETGSQIRSYRPTRSVARREDYLSDDSVPLFLSDSDELSKAPRFGRTGSRAVRSRRLLKTSILLIAAAGAAFAVSVRNPFTVFANATASLIGISDVRSAPVPASPAVQSTAGVRASPPTTGQAPTRDEIASALRTAHQSQAPAEVHQPLVAALPATAALPVAAAPPVAVAPPVALAPPVVAAPPVSTAPPVRKLGADELATLMSRAKGLLAAGDIPPARLLLERAADAQEPSAALMLAQTYDPAVLGTRDTRNINTDPAMARTWYERAAQLGSADAQRRLSQLQ